MKNISLFLVLMYLNISFIARLDAQSNEFLLGKKITCFAKANDSLILVGTETGLFRIANSTTPIEVTNFTGYFITDIAINSAGQETWIACKSRNNLPYAQLGGVYKLATPLSDIWVKYYSTNDGLPSKAVFSIEIDSNGGIWTAHSNHVKSSVEPTVIVDGGIGFSANGSSAFIDKSSSLPFSCGSKICFTVGKGKDANMWASVKRSNNCTTESSIYSFAVNSNLLQRYDKTSMPPNAQPFFTGLAFLSAVYNNGSLKIFEMCHQVHCLYNYLSNKVNLFNGQKIAV